MRVFGCTTFMHIKRNDKLDFVSQKTIFLGYSSYKKGYKCYDPINKKLYLSRNVTFFENEPYFKEKEVFHQTYLNNQNDNIVFPYLDDLSFIQKIIIKLKIIKKMKLIMI